MDIRFNYEPISELRTKIEEVASIVNFQVNPLQDMGTKFAENCQFYCSNDKGDSVDILHAHRYIQGFYENGSKLLSAIVENLNQLSEIINNKVSSYSQADMEAVEELGDINNMLNDIL